MEKEYLSVIYTSLDKSLEKQAAALPREFNKQRFLQNCMTVLQDGTTDFSNVQPATVVRTLLKGAFLGLDFFNKECYAIKYGNQVNFQTDYKGEKKLCKKYSIVPIQDIYAKVVREGDWFEEKIIEGRQSIDFKPLPFNEGKIIGAFAVVLYKDGGMEYEAMSVNDIEDTRRQYSKAPNSTAWKNSFGEMAKKTVLRRLCKHIELDFESIEQRKLYEEASDFDVDKKPEHEDAIDPLNEEITDAEFKEIPVGNEDEDAAEQ